MASSSSTEPDRFVVGRLGRPHGLDGFLGLYVEEEDVEALQPGATVHIDEQPYTIRAIRRVDRGYQIAFDGVDDRFDAEAIRGRDVLIDERRELRTGEYWPGDLIGVAVFDTNGKSLGKVKDVLFGPAQDRLLIEPVSGTAFEVPFVDQLVPLVDLDRRRIEILPLPGLIGPRD